MIGIFSPNKPPSPSSNGHTPGYSSQSQQSQQENHDRFEFSQFQPQEEKNDSRSQPPLTIYTLGQKHEFHPIPDNEIVRIMRANGLDVNLENLPLYKEEQENEIILYDPNTDTRTRNIIRNFQVNNESIINALKRPNSDENDVLNYAKALHRDVRSNFTKSNENPLFYQILFNSPYLAGKFIHADDILDIGVCRHRAELAKRISDETNKNTGRPLFNTTIYAYPDGTHTFNYFEVLNPTKPENTFIKFDALDESEPVFIPIKEALANNIIPLNKAIQKGLITRGEATLQGLYNYELVSDAEIKDSLDLTKIPPDLKDACSNNDEISSRIRTLLKLDRLNDAVIKRNINQEIRTRIINDMNSDAQRLNRPFDIPNIQEQSARLLNLTNNANILTLIQNIRKRSLLADKT